MSELLIPNLQKEKIIEYLAQDKRFDGRNSTQYRELEVEKGISKNAEAAVRVKLGKTEVLAGVKMALTEPYPDSPNQGTFMTTAELHPMASNEFELGRPGINAVELARVVDRGIRESGFIDFEKLCIKEGERVWQVFLDIVALNDDGNLLDVAGIAGLIALGQAKLPVYNEAEDKTEHELSANPLPLNKEALSFNMTFHSIGEKIVADVSKEEEAISHYRLSIAMGDEKGSPRITAMQKGKAGSISEEEMKTIIKLATDTWKAQFPTIKEHVFGK